jgi:hypothetical protein
MFWIKKSEIILDCFTHRKYIYDNAKIDYSHKYYPEWWKNTDKKTAKGAPTIKHCIAFQDFYKRGVVIPSWFDLELTIFDKNQERWYEWEASNHDVDTDNSHPPSQFIHFSENNIKNMKFSSPWLCKTKEEIYWTWTQPTWSNRSFLGNCYLMPAVTNFKYQRETHINFMIINTDTTYSHRIHPLTPLVILHPMTEKKIKLKHHLIDEKEYESLFGIRNLLLGRGDYQDSVSRYKKSQTIINRVNDH